MAGKKQVIRRVEHAGLADFDDQLWPINCALLVLAGFVAGIIIATSDFQGGSLLASGWLRLALLAVTLVTLFLGTWWLHRKQHVRRMQLAIFLSLLMNLGLQVWLFRSFMALTAVAPDPQTSEWIDEREALTLPDYSRLPAEEALPQDFERPVETVTPQAQPQQVSRQETPPQPTARAQASTSEPAAATAQPAPEELERAQAAAPAARRSDQPSGSQISRQQSRAPATPTEAIPAPQTTAATAERQPALNSQVAPVERSATGDPQLARRPPSPNETAPARAAQQQLQRAETGSNAVRPNAVTTTTPRQAPQSPEQPRSPAENTSPAAAASPTSSPALSPSAATIARQAPSAPATQQTVDAPAIAGNPQPTAANLARQSAAADAPQTAQPAAGSVSRQAPSATPSTVAAAAQPASTAAATAAAATALQPAAATVARQQATPSTSSASSAGSTAPTETTSQSARVSSSDLSRATAATSDAPSNAPAANPTAVARANSAPANTRASTTAQQIAATPSTISTAGSGQLEASSGTAASRAAAATPASSGVGAASSLAGSSATQQLGPAAMSRAATTGAAGPAAAPQPAQLGRTAASRTASSVASAAAEAPAATVAEAGGTPAPSANAQATTVARSSGAVSLTAGAGPAQPLPGEALNTSRGLAQAAPRRVETSTDSSLRSNSPGAGQLARSQGVASSSGPTTAVPLEAPTAAPGSLAQQASAAPQQTLTGVARASGRAPVASPAALSASESGGGATAGASVSTLNRANDNVPGSSPQIGQGGSPLARTMHAATGAGSGMAAAAEVAPGAGAAGGEVGSLAAAAGQVARQATSVGNPSGHLSSGGAPGLTAAASAVSGGGPRRATTGSSPDAAPSGQAGPLARATTTAGAASTSMAEAAAVGPSPAVATANEISASTGTNQSRQTAGLSGPLAGRGQLAGEASAPSSNALASGSAPRRASSGDGPGPQLPGLASLEPDRQGAAGAMPAGLAEADEPGPVAGAASSEPVVLAGQGLATGVTRQASGAIPVQIAALEGPGSLSETASPLPGLPNRRARADAESIQKVAQRFLLDRTTGPLPNRGLGLEKAADAFLQRAPEQRGDTARSRGGSASSERAVEMGLEYLARQQLRDGRWSLQNAATGGAAQDAAASAGQMQADTASTGLALLCYLGAGYTHTEGKYRDTVAAGVAHLVQNQKANGDLFAGGSKYVWFYSHGIASISLCEAYGMTKDPQLREPAQKALDFILASQHPTFGGWRYAPQSSTDTSVSGWQMMALKSGELAGLTVPKQAYERISRWLDGAQTYGGAQYSYRPEAQIAHQRNPSLAMTAEGLLMRLYTGWERSHPQVVAGAEHLRQNLPSLGTRTQPLRDSYYWYYATQVMFQMQGDAWNAWNERLRNLLTTSQTQSGPLVGSWDPRGAVPDRWGLEAGRLYVTSMNLLMLEVYYRHLPLYKID